MSDEYAPYDPTEVIPTVLAADPDDTPTQIADPDDPDLPSFDPRHRQAFTGLAFLGALTRTFNLFGHRITIRNLRSNELLSVAEVTAPYTGTLGEAKAYSQAVVAHCVMTVDGRELPVLPLGDGADQVTVSQLRFDWVGENWFAPVVGAIFEKYLALTDTVEQVLDAMGKASAQQG